MPSCVLDKRKNTTKGAFTVLVAAVHWSPCVFAFYTRGKAAAVCIRGDEADSGCALPLLVANSVHLVLI
jgi:hypothetical protein